MEKKKISIIVPIYNVEKYLKKCVESILNQTYKNIEVILINDGSTDNANEICLELEKNDQRVKYISTKNKGVCHARNEGLLIATGEYITFVDADDYIEPNMYEEMIKDIEKNNADIGICGYDTGDTTKEKTLEKKIFDREEAIKNLFNDNSYRGFLWNKVYKKEVLYDEEKNIKLFDERLKILEDLVYNYDIFNKINKVIYNHKKFYHYIQRESSVLNTKFSKARLTTLIALDILIEKIQDEYIKNELKIHYLRSASHSLYYLKKDKKNNLDIIKKLRKAKKKYKTDIICNKNIDIKSKIKCIIWYYVPDIVILMNQKSTK